MSVRARPGVGIAVLVALCVAALMVRAAVQVLAPASIDKRDLVAALERYRARGALVQLGDWIGAQPQLGAMSVPRIVASYQRILGLASGAILALAPLGAEGIGFNGAYRDDRLNLYVIRRNAAEDPDRLLDRTGVAGNAGLVFGNIILVDIAMFDRLAAIFHRGDAAWARENPGCDDFAHTREGDPLVSEPHADPRLERCALARNLQFIQNMLRLSVPLWILLHEIGHFANGHAAGSAGWTPAQTIAAEQEADAFLMRVVSLDQSGQLQLMIAAPLVTVLHASIEEELHRPLRDLLDADPGRVYPIAFQGTHPSLSYRALTLVSLSVDLAIARGGYPEFGHDGQLLSTDRNRYAELLRRIRIIAPPRGVLEVLGIAEDPS